MYFRSVICLLVVGAVAAKIDFSFVSKHGGFHKPLAAEPKPCCAPKQSTYDVVEFISFQEGGEFKLEYTNYNSAYDAKGERLGMEVAYTNFNGTNTYSKRILDFKNHEAYVIHITGVCHKFQTKGKFPEECVPGDAKLFNTATLGDDKIQLVTWGWETKTETGESFNTGTVDEKHCLPIGGFKRDFDPKTNEQLKFAETRIYNYKEGIDDPDKYFKVPSSCNKASLSTKRHQAMKYLGRSRLLF